MFVEPGSFLKSIMTDAKTLISSDRDLCALKIASEIQNIIEKQKNN